MAYQQETELTVLLKMLARLDNKIVIDVGAEKGSVTRVCLEQGCEAVYAFEPYPPNMKILQEQFANQPKARLYEMAVGLQDETAQLNIAKDISEAGLDAYHSLVQSQDTPILRWTGRIPVQVRSLDSLVADGSLPAEVGILKIDTEGNDFNVLQGMGRLKSAVVMIECWDNLPETVGQLPYKLSQVVPFMQQRGYNHFAYIYRNGDFEGVRVNDPRTHSGDWGNVVFMHNSHYPVVSPVIDETVNAAQDRAAGMIAHPWPLFVGQIRRRIGRFVRRVAPILRRP